MSSERPEGALEWQALAQCYGEDPEIFFTPEGLKGREGSEVRAELERRAKDICARCFVAEECLDAALRRPEKYGIWGGKTESERETILKTRYERRRRR